MDYVGRWGDVNALDAMELTGVRSKPKKGVGSWTKQNKRKAKDWSLARGNGLMREEVGRILVTDLGRLLELIQLRGRDTLHLFRLLAWRLVCLFCNRLVSGVRESQGALDQQRPRNHLHDSARQSTRPKVLDAHLLQIHHDAEHILHEDVDGSLR